VALVVTTDLTMVCDGSSGQDSGWTGEDGVNTEIYQQGTSSQVWQIGKNALETAVYDYYSENSNTAADVSAADTHLYMHIRCDIAPFLDYFSIKLIDGSSNYSTWHVVNNTGATEWYGEWKTFIIDLSSTPDDTSGTLSKSDVRTFNFIGDNRTSGNIRIVDNTYIDIVRFGTGITAYDDADTTAFDLADIVAISDSGTNKYGIIEEIGGIFFAKGRITIGDNSGTNDANFVTQNETVVWLAPTAQESMSTGLYQFNVVGNATGTTHCVIGTAVGSGDTQTGRDGSTFMAESGASIVGVDISTSNVSDVKLYGAVFRALGGTFDFDTSTTTNRAISGCTFDGLDQINVGQVPMRKCNILNTDAISTSGAIQMDNDTDIKNCLFVNNTNSIEIPADATGHFTFAGMEFSGGTYDVRYEGTTDYNINWSDAAGAPTIDNTSTGTLTAVSAVSATTTITVKDIGTGADIEGARVLLLASDATGDFPFEESVTEITRSSSTATVDHTAHGMTTGDFAYIQGANQTEYNGAYEITVTGVDDYTYTVAGTPVTPATGTIISTGGYFNSLTNPSGIVTDTRSIDSDQPVEGRVRKSTSTPLYKSSPLTGTVDTENGLNILVQLIPDE